MNGITINTGMSNHDKFKNWIYLCSPYRDNIPKSIEIAKNVCKIAVRLGYLPIAPHLYFTQFLDEIHNRYRGMELGEQMLELCSEMWIIGEHITEGMAEEIHFAKSKNIPIKFIPATLSMYDLPEPEPYEPKPMEVVVTNESLTVDVNKASLL